MSSSAAVIVLASPGAAERILDWVGSKIFLGEEFYYLRKFFYPQGGIPSNIG